MNNNSADLARNGRANSAPRIFYAVENVRQDNTSTQIPHDALIFEWG